MDLSKHLGAGSVNAVTTSGDGLGHPLAPRASSCGSRYSCLISFPPVRYRTDANRGGARRCLQTGSLSGRLGPCRAYVPEQAGTLDCEIAVGIRRCSLQWAESSRTSTVYARRLMQRAQRRAAFVFLFNFPDHLPPRRRRYMLRGDGKVLNAFDLVSFPRP